MIPYVESPSFTIQSEEIIPVLYEQPSQQASSNNGCHLSREQCHIRRFPSTNIALGTATVSNISVGNSGWSNATGCNASWCIAIGPSLGYSLPDYLTPVNQSIGFATNRYVGTGAFSTHQHRVHRCSSSSPFAATLATSGPETDQQQQGEILVLAS